MSSSSPVSRLVWLLPLLAALGWVAWTAHVRIERADAIAHSVPADIAPAPVSPTGYAGGIRALVIPEPSADAAQWIIRTQQLLASPTQPRHRIDYENAPLGREVVSPAPYRWWLGTVAALHRTFTGSSPGLSVERAALYADPLLQLLVLVVATSFAAWRFGALAASALALGLAALFPFAGSFVPGLPDDQGLALSFALASVLPLLAGLTATGVATTSVAGQRASRTWFCVAGVIGGLGLWVSIAHAFPIVIGLALGALGAAWQARRNNADNSVAMVANAPWLLWAAGGTASSALGYFLEYYPGEFGHWQLRAVHPLYSLAWLGIGLALSVTVPLVARRAPGTRRQLIVRVILAVVAIAALPLVAWQTKAATFLTTEVAAFRLGALAPGVQAPSLWRWLTHDGINSTAALTLLPAMLLLPAGWLLFGKTTSLANRNRLAVALGPVLVALVFAAWQLSWWSFFDALLLPVVIATVLAWSADAKRNGRRIATLATVAIVLVAGATKLVPPTGKLVVESSELSALIERDLAHWLAKRVGGAKAIVLAPPPETTALAYYGGLSGLGTLSLENREGIVAMVRILSATTPQEALALINARGITHLVLPSWDSYLAEYVRVGAPQGSDTFYSGLKSWALPGWLRPVPYQTPAVTGYEGQYVAVFEVVEEQSESVALSRLAVYFAEMGQQELAAAVAQSLQRFPSDLGALAARAEVAMTRNNEAGLVEVMRVLAPKLTGGADRALPWERRVGLAVVLARAKQNDLAKEQTRRCYAESTLARLRSLSPDALYRLLLLGKVFGLEFSDPQLKAQALEMLPGDWRAKL